MFWAASQCAKAKNNFNVHLPVKDTNKPMECSLKKDALSCKMSTSLYNSTDNFLQNIIKQNKPHKKYILYD